MEGDAKREVKGRFAPSPTGRMHAGNIFAALMSWLIVHAQGGTIVLRIEDLDRQRSKPIYIDQIQRDFESLGLGWDEGPYFQHDRDEAYRAAFDELAGKGLVYPCFCSRADLHAASAPHRGEKLVYPGTCRNLSADQISQRAAERDPSWRVRVPNRSICFEDLVQGPFGQELETECGDFVVRRSDGLFAYQLAVVVDDAEQGIDCIVRGMDLLVSTPQQIFLQNMLGYGKCSYAHVPLIVGELDRRLSKRDRDAALDELLIRFHTPEAIIGHIAYITGLAEDDSPRTPEELLKDFDLARLKDTTQIIWN